MNTVLLSQTHTCEELAHLESLDEAPTLESYIFYTCPLCKEKVSEWINHDGCFGSDCNSCGERLNFVDDSM